MPGTGLGAEDVTVTETDEVPAPWGLHARWRTREMNKYMHDTGQVRTRKNVKQVRP